MESDKGAVPKKVTPTAGNDFEPVESRKSTIEKNPQYCQRARDNIWALDHHARIRVRNDAGELAFIDEEQKQVQRQQSIEAIEAYCE